MGQSNSLEATKPYNGEEVSILNSSSPKHKPLKFLLFPCISIALLLIAIVGFKFLIFRIDSSWTREKAEYLARRALLNPSIEDVNKLTNAGSASNAVNTLFAEPSSAVIETYTKGLNELSQTQNTYQDDNAYHNVLYTYKLINDPYRTRRKLFYLWGNIFSVDPSDPDEQISLNDIDTLHNIIYADTFGNYKDMLGKVNTNYALTKFLNLPDSKGDNPNENFARELMQLFSMGEYSPIQTNVRNYSEEDVNALAYILSGYNVTKDKQLYLVQNDHYQEKKMFLGEEFNDPSTIIPYLFNKRSAQIAQFLANKLLRYYVSDNPSTLDIEEVSKIILQNKFEILPSVKWLLSSHIMYQKKYMQETRVKTPLEVIASTYTALYGNDAGLITPQPYELDMLNFIPYYPKTVFGRNGFVHNENFLSGTILNRWLGSLTQFTFRDDKNLIEKRKKRLLQDITHSKSPTPDLLVDQFEKYFLLGRRLPESVRIQLKHFLTTDANEQTIDFSINDPDYQSSKIFGLASLMLSQPEFLFQSGYASINSNNQSQISLQKTDKNFPKLILVKLDGGVDYQQIVANIADPKYKEFRQDLALTENTSTPLINGYVLNNLASSLLPTIATHEAFFINSVGVPGHDRAHDIATEQMETGLGKDLGIISRHFGNDIADIDLVSLTNDPPIMYRGNPSLQIGSSDLRLYTRPTTGDPDGFDRYKTLKARFSDSASSTLVAKLYSQAFFLDTISNDVLTTHSATTSGDFNNKQQFAYISRLMDGQIGKVYYLYADGGYDTHSDEKRVLKEEFPDFIATVTNFYNENKTKYPLTIVLYSEFGRTNKVNASGGTDHGTAGGIIILSNILKWPLMTGLLSPSQDTEDWLTVQVDARDVWATLFHDLYHSSIKQLFGRDNTIYDYPQPVYMRDKHL